MVGGKNSSRQVLKQEESEEFHQQKSVCEDEQTLHHTEKAKKVPLKMRAEKPSLQKQRPEDADTTLHARFTEARVINERANVNRVATTSSTIPNRMLHLCSPSLPMFSDLEQQTNRALRQLDKVLLQQAYGYHVLKQEAGEQYNGDLALARMALHENVRRRVLEKMVSAHVQRMVRSHHGQKMLLLKAQMDHDGNVNQARKAMEQFLIRKWTKQVEMQRRLRQERELSEGADI